ncbi:MAG: sugar transferase [Candidatus Eisenbacteria sp.]|nr:sugar transferase [Candidatus Eisenbacteria bacterium]
MATTRKSGKASAGGGTGTRVTAGKDPARKRSQFPFLEVLVAGDFIAVFASLLLAYWIRLGSGWYGAWAPLAGYHFAIAAVISLIWLGLFRMNRLYHEARLRTILDQFAVIVKSVTLGILLLLAAAFLTKTGYFIERRLVVLLAWVNTVVLVSAFRVLVIRPLYLRFLRSVPAQTRLLVVGAGEAGSRFAREIGQRRDSGIEVIGFLDDDPQKIGAAVAGYPVLDSIMGVRQVVESYGVHQISVAIPSMDQNATLEMMSRCMRAGVPVKLVGDAFHALASDTVVEMVDGIPTIALRESSFRGFGLVLKRWMDVVACATFLVMFAPLLGLIAILIKTLSPGPVLFRQIRAGKNGEDFALYKFRTMVANSDDSVHRRYAAKLIGGKDMNIKDKVSDKEVFKLTDDPRVTRIGKVLRRTSLDELPQLINVLKGEMSLVGPRPPIAYELGHYRGWHKKRLEAKPGLTGLWQVSGRSSVPFDEMVLLDLYYIDHWSLAMDLEILLRTIPVVVLGKGAY